MKAVVLAGGLGTRLAEETDMRPKPLVEVGGMPILWHILKLYDHYGIKDFIICAGYKGHLIKEFFANFRFHARDIIVNLQNGSVSALGREPASWTITVVDTGIDTMVGGRIKRILPMVASDDLFCLTYGDGVCDVNISDLVSFHRSHGKLATVTAVRPPSRFGILQTLNSQVTSFNEKPLEDGTWVNGGFFVLSPEIGQYIRGDDSVWEHEPLQALSTDGELHAFFHRGFWQPMDTLRDKRHLEQLWATGNAPWKVWPE
jgi:glucose-1-phosphate cytidylyltransferase